MRKTLHQLALSAALVTAPLSESVAQEEVPKDPAICLHAAMVQTVSENGGGKVQPSRFLDSGIFASTGISDITKSIGNKEWKVQLPFYVTFDGKVATIKISDPETNSEVSGIMHANSGKGLAISKSTEDYALVLRGGDITGGFLKKALPCMEKYTSPRPSP